jgi:hypothetical protein
MQPTVTDQMNAESKPGNEPKTKLVQVSVDWRVWRGQPSIVNGTGNPQVSFGVPAPAPTEPVPTAAGMGRVGVLARVHYGSISFTGSAGTVITTTRLRAWSSP